MQVLLDAALSFQIALSLLRFVRWWYGYSHRQWLHDLYWVNLVGVVLLLGILRN